MKIADRVNKFRAWDEVRNKMHTHPKWVEFQVDSNGVLTAQNFDFKGNVQDLPILQFTGLQDVNGVDIYEGDVLRCYPDDITLSYSRVVEWDSNRCELGITTNGRSGVVLCKAASKSYEIIGNIYENKDLLC